MALNKRQIVTGILSYGMSGRVFHAPFIDLHTGFTLYAVVERSIQRAQQRYPSIRSFDTVEALLADPTIDLVVVNTPNDTHFTYARAALEAGKDVLIEKPFAATVQEAEDLFSLAARLGKRVFAYQNRRYDSDFQSLAAALHNKSVGKPIELHMRFDRFRPQIGAKAFKEEARPAAGILYDLGSHLLDQAIHLFGQPRSAEVTRGYFRENTLVDDYGYMRVLFDHGPLVHITVSHLVASAAPSYVLHGSKGSFVVGRTDVQEDQLQAGLSPLSVAYGLEPPHCEALLTKADLLGNRSSSLMPSQRGNYMQVYDALYNSISFGHPFDVQPQEILWQLAILAQTDISLR